MRIFKGLGVCLTMVFIGACAPYPHNEYYQEYYGGYPYSSRTYVSYYDAYPYYYWNPWYGYPWYWYDRPDDDDDDDDDDDHHHHRPPHHGDRGQGEALLSQQTPPSEVRPEDLSRIREDIADLQVSRQTQVVRSARLQSGGPSSLQRGGFNAGAPRSAGSSSRRLWPLERGGRVSSGGASSRRR